MAIEKKRVINIETGRSQQNVQTLKQQIKELRDSMGNMEKGTEDWEKASVKLSNALQKQREIAEAGTFTNQDYGNKLANITKVGAGVAAGINGITNALSLMGVQIAKDDNAMIRFTTSMMAIVQGLSTFDTASKAWKGLVVGMNAALDARLKDTASTAANTITTKVNTGAKTENTAATNAGSAATAVATKANNGLSAAFTKLAAAMGISKAALGGITAAIGVLVAAIGVLINQWKKAREEEQRLNEQMSKTAEEAAKIKSEINMLHYDFDRLASSFRTAKEEGQDLTEWVKDHRSELDKLKISTDDLTKIEDVFVNNTDEYKKALAERYKAEAQMIAYREQLVEQYRILNQMQDIKTDGSGKQYYMLDGKKVYTGGAKTAFEQDQRKKVIDAIVEKMNGVQTTLDNSNRTLTKIAGKDDEKPSGTKQQPLTVEVINSTELIKDSRSLRNTLNSTVENFKENKDERVNINSFLNSIRILLADNVDSEKYLNEELVSFLKKGYEIDENYDIDTIYKTAFQYLSKGESGVLSYRDNLNYWLRYMYNTEWQEGFVVKDKGILGTDMLKRENLFNSDNISNLTRELDDLVEQIETFDAANEKKVEDIKKHNANIAATNQRLNKELEAEKKENEQRKREINEYVSRIATIQREIEKIEIERDEIGEHINELNEKKIETGALKKKGSIDKEIEIEENKINNLSASINKKYKELKELTDTISDIYKREQELTKEINENSKKYLSENITTPEYKEYIDGLRARVDELKTIIPVLQNIATVYNELEDSTIEGVVKVGNILKNEYFDRMEMEGASREQIIEDIRAFNELEKESLGDYLKNTTLSNEKRLEVQQRINTLTKENFELEREAQDIAWKRGKAELDVIQQRIALQMEEREHYQNMYNLSWERLGSADFNDNLYRLEIEQKYYDERFRIAEEFRQQNKISEEDYQQELLDYQTNTTRMMVEMEEARARRMLDILDTSISAVGMTVNSVNGLIGEALAREEQDSTRYKQLRIAQTIASGSMASIEALRSGIQSPIPAPGNYVLGIALMGATIAQTAMAVGNIRTNSLNGNSSSSLTTGANNIGGNVYETLAYETNSEISSNIRDSRVYVVESDINQTGRRVYTAESEARF